MVNDSHEWHKQAVTASIFVANYGSESRLIVCDNNDRAKSDPKAAL